MEEGVHDCKKLLPLILASIFMHTLVAEGVWCVARSGASDDVLQSALDYACAAGADCGPISENGLCFLPNTLQAHASYAFNSLYQRNHMAASSCDFSGSATIAQTDPSYGSCVYPASPSTAGSITGGTQMTNPSGTTSPLTPTTTAPPTLGGGVPGMGLNPNNMGPPIPVTNDSTATPKSSSLSVTLVLKMFLFLQFVVAIFGGV